MPHNPFLTRDLGYPYHEVEASIQRAMDQLLHDIANGCTDGRGGFIPAVKGILPYASDHPAKPLDGSVIPSQKGARS